MYQLNQILENKVINNLISGFKRSPDQINNLHESDSEIVKVRNQKIAITTDSIYEEISTGLYDDPYLVGWMIVTVNISDLAAVGATPKGIVISEIMPKDFNDDKLRLLQKGISDACNKYRTFVLGGDTNEGENLVLTGTAIGVINSQKTLSRVGCKYGDVIYSSGRLGRGNAFGISKLISKINYLTNYKPVARIKECELISKYASACMDSSDGLISTLDQLMRLNNVGFEIIQDFEELIDKKAFSYVINQNIAPWLLFAGQHGEFELIFTIPQNFENEFLAEAINNGFAPIKLGLVIQPKEIRLKLYNQLIPIDSELIRNLPYNTKGDVNHYLKLLLEYDSEIKQNHEFNFTSD